MSEAVGLDRISTVVGYKITKGDFKEVSPNLPQRVAILAEANTANQGNTTKKEITTAQQAGNLYGFGSPVYSIMRILRPLQGGGLGGIPTIVYAQDEAVAAAAHVIDITPVGTATANGTIFLVIAGRSGVDALIYAVNIVVGDTVSDVTLKITDAVNAVTASPMTAVDGTTKSSLTTKWAGLTSQEVNVTVDLNDTNLGFTFGTAEITPGTGTPDIAAALAQFGNDWNTIVINSYGTVVSTLDALEDFNGIPDPNTPTGRYTGIIFKPFIALTGSLADDPTSVTDTRKDEVTISICPAPLSAGTSMEAAANMCFLFARQAQDNPNLDVQDRSYPDMPTPSDIGSMAVYNNRDSFVKKGSSTVDLVNGRYQVKDFVTTYHPDGETPPQFRYCRNLNIDFNIRFAYFLLEEINVVAHQIADNDDTVTASKVIKPKQWVGIIDALADDLASRGIIVQAGFMQDSITVVISTSNPDRLESFFRYKRSGFARISSTTAEAGFNFGNI